MAETPTGKDLAYAKIRLRMVKHQAEKFIHNLSEIKRETVRELGQITTKTQQILNEKQYPQVLNFSVGEDEYVSLRRMGLDRLEVNFDVPEDPFNAIMSVSIPTKLLPEDGLVAVLVTPATFPVYPKDQDDAKFITESTGYGKDDTGWNDYFMLQWFLSGGGKYKKENWDLSRVTIGITPIKRVDTKFYTLGHGMVEEIKPDNRNNLQVPITPAYWSESEVEVQKELNQKLGILYILVKGSSQKEERSEGVASMQLTPSATTIKS